MSDVVNNSNIDCLQGNTTDIYHPHLRFGWYRSYCPEGSQYYLNILEYLGIFHIINRIRHLSCGFKKLYSPRFKCQQGKEGNISYIPFFTTAYGSLRVKKEGNIASGYFVIFITHRVRVCTENLGTSVAYCAFCNNGAQIGLRALYCDVIITPKAHCLQCIENFAKHWMHSAGLTMFLQLFMLRKPCAV